MILLRALHPDKSVKIVGIYSNDLAVTDLGMKEYSELHPDVVMYIPLQIKQNHVLDI